MKRFIVIIMVFFTSIVYSQDDLPDRDRPRLECELPSITVNLLEGWNMISINVSPPDRFWGRDVRGPDVVLMTEQLRIDEDHHRIIVLKDCDGQFYAPRWGFCNIRFWNLRLGYGINVNEDVEAIWFGNPIPPGTPIFLKEGWNYVAYYPHYRLDASAPDFYVLSGIINYVFIAKDSEGNFLSPRFNYSSMLPWRESQGYQIRVSTDLFLIYPPERENHFVDINSEASGINQWHSSTFQTAIPDNYFLSEAYPNPFNATVSLNYGLPEPTHVSISVYDVAGRLVETLINQNKKSGHFATLWNSTGGDAYATSGVYFVRMSAGEFEGVRKVMLSR